MLRHHPERIKTFGFGDRQRHVFAKPAVAIEDTLGSVSGRIDKARRDGIGDPHVIRQICSHAPLLYISPIV